MAWPSRRDVLLGEPERLAGRDAELVRDEVAPGHELGHRVLDLEAGVHLEERERAAIVEQELAGAGALVADGTGQPQGGLAHALAQRGVDRRGAGLLEHLLVASLDRAVAFAEVDAVAVAVEQDLDLDVPRALDQALEDQPIVAERARGLTAGGRQVGRQPIEVADRPHPLAAAAGGGLDQQRHADPLGGRGEGGVGLVRVVVALRHRDPQLRGEPAGLPPCRPSTGSPRAAARPTAARPRSPPRRTRRSPRGSRSPGGPRLRQPGGRPRSRPVRPAGRSPPDRWSRGRPSGCRGARTFARCVERSRRGSR